MVTRAPDQILSVAAMRGAEEALIASGSSVDALMASAGKGAADYVWRMAANRRVTVLCGPGNNGGDGWVIAETLRGRGVPVVVAMAATVEVENCRGRRFDGARGLAIRLVAAPLSRELFAIEAAPRRAPRARIILVERRMNERR